MRQLRAALALWRGQSLADVTGLVWLEEQAVRLDLLCLQVRRALADARLAAGEHAELVPELEEMVAESPLDEQVNGQLMLALYRCGRQADALAVYGRLRAVLAEQLGIDPSAMLRDLEVAILRQDEALAVPARFPDGQLYVNLRGFDPGGQPVDPGEAVRGFLAALGVAQAQIPGDVPAQAALYRSLLAGRRVLVVLDNARDVAQVRPLLPGSPGCLVIVTSRSDLAGLVAAEGAYPVSLDLLTPAEAGELLGRRLGEARVASEPAAVSEIIERCARLPLALAIAAARAAARPGFPLATIAAGLRGAAATLDPFGGPDLNTDVRAVFSWSCRLLSEDAARLFALLGLHPGPDISVRAAASLAAIAPARAQALLAELAGVHLLSEHSPDRYACHDLLRAYARELAESLDDVAARDLAVRRLLEHYLHTAHAAARLLKPEREPMALAAASPGTSAEDLTTTDSARAWFTTEHHVLLCCIRAAAAAGLDRHAWQLAWTVKTYLDTFRRTDDASGQAVALNGVGWAHALLGEYRQALTSCREALALIQELGLRDWQAHT